MNPPVPQDYADRRADRRYKVRFRLHWSRGESDEFAGEVTDLGAGGCFVESAEAVQEEDLVRLRLDVPGRGELTVWGHVSFWVRDTGFGVRFTPFSQGGALDKIREFLHEEACRA